MLTPRDCDKLCIYNVILRVITIKAYTEEILGNTVDKSKLNLSNLQQGKKKENKTEKGNIQKTKFFKRNHNHSSLQAFGCEMVKARSLATASWDKFPPSRWANSLISLVHL